MQNENIIRLGFFFIIFFTVAFWEFLAPFFTVAFWEFLAPRRVLTTSKTMRWISNLGITFINPLVLHLLFPILAVGMALKAHESGWGLLNIFELPYWVALVLILSSISSMPCFMPFLSCGGCTWCIMRTWITT